FLDKQFHGDLQGASRGQMLASGTGRDQSGGYVALELVTGVLNGKRGSFVLQHKGTMRKGAFAIEVSVVPDSGTDELAGISGAMTIRIESGRHSYELAYTLEPEGASTARRRCRRISGGHVRSGATMSEEARLRSSSALSAGRNDDDEDSRRGGSAAVPGPSIGRAGSHLRSPRAFAQRCRVNRRLRGPGRLR